MPDTTNSDTTNPGSIPIPEPLQRRILAKNAALQQARRELEELLDLTQELLNVPDGYVLYNVAQGFVRLPPEADVPPIGASDAGDIAASSSPFP